MKRGNIPDHLREPYVPEWMRLGKSPTPAELPAEERAKARNTFNQQIFQHHNQKPRVLFEEPKVLSAEDAAELDEPRIAMPVKAPSVPKFNQVKRKIPAVPVPVHVGNHEESSWTDEKSFLTNHNKHVQERDDSDEEIDVESVQGHDPSQISYEAEDSYETASHEQSRVHTPPALDVPEPPFLQENEYALVVSGILFHKFFDIEQLKKAVEYVVLDRDVSIKEIEVYQRVEVGFGVILKS